MKTVFTAICVCLAGVMFGAADLAQASEFLHCCEISDTVQCQQSCRQIFLSGEDGGSDPTFQERLIPDCPKYKNEFWLCINQSIEGPTWWGKPCCELSLDLQCKNSCQRAKSRDDILSFCQPASEMAIFQCLDKHEEGQRCCQSTSSQKCRAVCKSIFIQDYLPTQAQLNSARAHCDPRVAACMQNHTGGTPSRRPTDSLPCCNHSDSSVCRDACHNALSSLAAEEEIVDEVSKHCGLPNPTRPLWQCFLRSSTNNIRHHFSHGGSIEVTGIDGAKLQCCAKAATSQCRELCTRTYSRGWTETVNIFHQSCAYNPQERELNLCLEDVQESCQLGCNGLTFCTNFNHRPTELFRSCNPQADQEAKNAISLWKRGMISMPAPISYDIPVRNITVCQPRKWQATACVLQIKPCHSKGHTNWICRSDCMDILSECLDTSRVQPGMTPQTICNLLSAPDDSASCISLAPYLVGSHHQYADSEVTTPCNPNPCNLSQICEVSRRVCASGHSCPQFICKPGCSMGEVVTQLVPYNSYVKIPKTTSDSTEICYSMCFCGHHGSLHRCINNIDCRKKDTMQCLLKSGMIHSHGTEFNLGCNKCVCHHKDAICTVRQCPRPRASAEEITRFTGLPCYCNPQYTPVCGLNGQTYPNACLARCHGLNTSQFEIGACASKDPCSNNPCRGPDKCIRNTQVCLYNRLKPGECKQYDCIRQTDVCEKNSPTMPVCNTRGEEFPSLCQFLLSKNRTFAYRGHCKKGCRQSGRVCGVNGESYSSECSAWANGVLVDYNGHCRAIGQINYATMESWCPNITCQTRSHMSHCKPIVPPGACCPVCAGEIRILLSQKQMLELSDKSSPITVTEVLTVLRLQVSVAECDVFAYPSIEGDLVILVAPITTSPTPLQVNACMSETKKLGSLISSESPIITTFISASIFASAETRTSFSRSAAPYVSAAKCSSYERTLGWTSFIRLLSTFFCAYLTRVYSEPPTWIYVVT